MPNQTPTTLLEAWKLHPTRRAEMAALLREPALSDALAIIREKAFEPKPIPPGTGLMEWSALQNQRREGYLDCLANLCSLAKISPFRADSREPWESVGKEERIKAMEQELGIPADTRLPNSPVQPPQNGPAPVHGSTTGGPPAETTS